MIGHGTGGSWDSERRYPAGPCWAEAPQLPLRRSPGQPLVRGPSGWQNMEARDYPGFPKALNYGVCAYVHIYRYY